MTAEEMLTKLLTHFFGHDTLRWAYMEDTTLGDMDAELEAALLAFRAEHATNEGL